MPPIDWKPAPAGWRRAENGDDTDDADDGNSIGSSSLEDARVSPLLTVRRSNPLLWHACTIVTLGVAWVEICLTTLKKKQISEKVAALASASAALASASAALGAGRPCVQAMPSILGRSPQSGATARSR